MISKLELKRQLSHIFGGIVLVLLIKYDIIDLTYLLALIIIAIVFSITSKKFNIPFVRWIIKQLGREKEKIPGVGAITYLVGAFVVYGLFITQPNGKNIIMASLMILALGDSMPLFVRHIAKIKHPFNNEKFIEGALLGAVLGFLGAIMFVEPIAALLGSFAAMFVEGIDVKLGLAEVDDNITIPVVASVIIWAVLLL